jgi:nucleoside-diphosphate-sugar epimerase
MVGFKKILVTGGAGFIGSHLVSRLLRERYSVAVLDNLSSGNFEKLQKVASRRDFEFVRGDVRDRSAVEKALSGVDAVVHLAALINVERSVADPMETHDVNVNGTLAVLHESAKHGVKRFVFSSSAAVYGDCKELPVKEDVELRPMSPYGASKVSGEVYCRAFSSSYSLETVVMRPFNVYGVGNEGNPYSGVITKFLKCAFSDQVLTINGDGEQTRDFLSVDDLVDAIVLALEARSLKGEVVNVCTGRPVSINGVVECLEEVLKKELKVRHGPAANCEIRYSYGDPGNAARLLNFRARTSFEEGLEKLSKESLRD